MESVNVQHNDIKLGEILMDRTKRFIYEIDRTYYGILIFNKTTATSFKG